MAKQINTVLGPISSDELGFTLPHEHISGANWDLRVNFPDYFDAEKMAEVSIPSCKDAVNAGVKTLVDVTPIDVGRDVALLKKVAKESGLQILCCTGFSSYARPELAHKFDDWFVEMFVREYENGIANTGIRPALIKIYTDVDGMTPYAEKIIRCSAIASTKTGMPIISHTDPNQKLGFDQQNVIAKAGGDITKVAIGHVGCSKDLGYVEDILKNGSYVVLDRQGALYATWMTNEERLQNLITLCEHGWIDRILLSHDSCFFLDYNSPLTWSMFEGLYTSGSIKQYYNGYTYISRELCPQLRAAGFTQADIDKMTIDNPRRFLEMT